MEIEGLITDLAFLLLLGAVVTIIFKWIRQPVVLGYIVAGFLASPHFEYLPSVTTESNIEFWAQIGIVVLLFSLGLEFSFKKLLNVGGSAAVTSLIIVAGMMCCGFAIGTLLGFSRINSLFLGGMMSMSSTTIIRLNRLCRTYSRGFVCSVDDGYTFVNCDKRQCRRGGAAVLYSKTCVFPHHLVPCRCIPYTIHPECMPQVHKCRIAAGDFYGPLPWYGSVFCRMWIFIGARGICDGVDSGWN